MNHPGAEITICIVTYNRRADVDRALQSVYAYTSSLRVEVIVVDNQSTDGTSQFIAEKYPKVKLIYKPVNQGYTPAMNLALAQAKGDFVMPLSSDAELKPGSVEALLDFMRFHPSAGLAGPRTLDAQGQIVTTLHHRSILLSLWTEIIPVKRWLRRARLVRWILTKVLPNSSGLTSDYFRTHRVQLIDGCGVVIRRKALDAVGLLDPLIPLGPDDYDFCHRISRAGFEIWFVAESEIIHRTSVKEEIKNLSPLYLRLKTSVPCYLYRKYHSGLRAKLFCLSAYLLTLKLQNEAKRLWGKESEEVAALVEAADLCLHPGRYSNEYKELWHRGFHAES